MADFTREQALAEAVRRGLIPRADLEAEARRRGLIPQAAQTDFGQPPEGMVLDPDTGSYVDTKREAQRRWIESPTYRLGAYGAEVLGGIPFAGEWVDEGVGALAGDLAQARWRAGREQVQEAAPTASIAAGVGAGLATAGPALRAAGPAMEAMAGRSLVSRAAAGAGAGTVGGATEGAVTGAGAADGGDRAGGAVRGAAVGGALGLALGVAGPVAADAVGYAARRIGRTARRSAAEARALGGSRESVEAVGRALEADTPMGAVRGIREGGEGAMIADAGPATAGLLDTAIQTGGPAAQTARRAVEGRANAANATLSQALDQSFGSLSAKPAPRASLGPLYERAYATPINYASRAGQEIEGLLGRVPGAVIQRANRLMQLEGQQSQQIMATIADNGSVTYQRMPDVRQIDYITRALNDQAKSGEAAGALGGRTAESRLLANLARDLRTPLKEAVPAYRTALDRAATEIGIREAQDLGEVAMRSTTTRGDLADALAGMGAAEKAALKRGVRAHFDEAAANVRRAVADGNMSAREAIQTLRDLSSRASRDKLEMILGKDGARALGGTIRKAEKAFELRASVATNSRTFGRQVGRESVRESVEPGAVRKLISGEPVASARGIMQRLVKTRPEDLAAEEARVFNEITQLLTGDRGNDATRKAVAIIRYMQQQPETKALADRLANRFAERLAIGGYAVGSEEAQPR